MSDAPEQWTFDAVTNAAAYQLMMGLVMSPQFAEVVQAAHLTLYPADGDVMTTRGNVTIADVPTDVKAHGMAVYLAIHQALVDLLAEAGEHIGKMLLDD